MKKLYYSIREVSTQTGVEPHVLRFWEKEFPMLRPRRGRSGNRFYRERDIRIVLAIKELRHNKKYTVKGAVERLKEHPSLWQQHSLQPKVEERPEPQHSGALLSDLRGMLLELKNLIDGKT